MRMMPKQVTDFHHMEKKVGNTLCKKYVKMANKYMHLQHNPKATGKIKRQHCYQFQYVLAPCRRRSKNICDWLEKVE